MSSIHKKYETYKDSKVEWIGEIPSHWTVDYVTKYFEISKQKISEGLVDALSVGYMGVVPQLENAAKNNSGGDRKLVYPGDIVINSRSDRMGAAGLSVHKGGVSLVYHVLRPKRKYQGNYYHYVYRNNMFSQEFYKQGSGIVDDLWSTKDSELVRIKLPNPSEEEKKRIASYIDNKITQVNGLINKKQKVIELLKEKRQALITQAVTKGLDPNAKMKESGLEGIGEVPAKWEWKRFKQISYMKGRIGWQGLKQDEFTFNENEPFLITGMNFKDGMIRWNEVYHIPIERFGEAPEIHLKKYDVLMTKDGSIGKLLFVEDIPYPNKASLNSHLLVLRPLNGSYNPKFVYYNLSSLLFHRHIEITKTGTTFYGISQKSVGEYRVLLPSITDQNNIVENLDINTNNIYLAMDKINEQIERLSEYKSALIYNAITGKIKV